MILPHSEEHFCNALETGCWQCPMHDNLNSTTKLYKACHHDTHYVLCIHKGSVMACVNYEPKSHSLIKNKHSFSYPPIFKKHSQSVECDRAWLVTVMTCYEMITSPNFETRFTQLFQEFNLSPDIFGRTLLPSNNTPIFMVPSPILCTGCVEVKIVLWGMSHDTCYTELERIRDMILCYK